MRDPSGCRASIIDRVSEAPAQKKSYKIGEVCRLADVQPYVLRYWETEFAPLSPNKTGGGQRLYSQREIEIILRIKQLLYTEGFTIAGAKKKLELELDDNGHIQTVPSAEAKPARRAGKNSDGLRKQLTETRRALREILNLLD